MASPNVARLIYGGAVAVWVLGAGWSMRTVATLRVRETQCRDRLQQLAELRMLAAHSQRAEGARTTVQASATGAVAADIEARLKSALPGVRVEVRGHATALDDGWTLRENELELDEVPLESALALAAALEQERPPWRLSACDIRASPSTPGNGHVVLTLTRLQPEG